MSPIEAQAAHFRPHRPRG